jgi:hypothetical protein
MSAYLSVDSMENFMLIVGLEPTPPRVVIKAWNQKQRRRVLRWAGAILYRASDCDVAIPRLPAVCKPYFNRYGHPVTARRRW